MQKTNLYILKSIYLPISFILIIESTVQGVPIFFSITTEEKPLSSCSALKITLFFSSNGDDE